MDSGLVNDPIPAYAAPLRSVRMALTMRQRVQELADSWQRRGHELALGWDIAQGYATLGQVGDADRFEYASVGSVSNLAARLCAEAAPWQILVTQRVKRGSGGARGEPWSASSRCAASPGRSAPSRFPGSTPRRSLHDSRDGAKLTLAELSDEECNERFYRLQERMRGVWEIKTTQRGGRVRRCRSLGQLGPRWRAKWLPTQQAQRHPHVRVRSFSSATGMTGTQPQPRSKSLPGPMSIPLMRMTARTLWGSRLRPLWLTWASTWPGPGAVSTNRSE